MTTLSNKSKGLVVLKIMVMVMCNWKLLVLCASVLALSSDRGVVKFPLMLSHKIA
jgi:hypothetical protein